MRISSGLSHHAHRKGRKFWCRHRLSRKNCLGWYVLIALFCKRTLCSCLRTSTLVWSSRSALEHLARSRLFRYYKTGISPKTNKSNYLIDDKSQTYWLVCSFPAQIVNPSGHSDIALYSLNQIDVFISQELSLSSRIHIDDIQCFKIRNLTGVIASGRFLPSIGWPSLTGSRSFPIPRVVQLKGCGWRPCWLGHWLELVELS